MTKRLLLVEDEPLVSASTAFLLQRSGFRSVDVAATIKDAICSIDKYHFDLAIVDYHIGTQTIEPVIAELAQKSIPYILLSGRSECLSSQIYPVPRAIISKPYPPKVLIEEAQAILEKVPHKVRASF